MKYPAALNFIDGQFVSSTSNRFSAVECPLDGSVISEVPMSNHHDLNVVVRSAKAAQKTWEKIPIKERAQIFYRYKQLLEKNGNELSGLIVEENGKTLEEANAEIEKAIELTEFACSL